MSSTYSSVDKLMQSVASDQDDGTAYRFVITVDGELLYISPNFDDALKSKGIEDFSMVSFPVSLPEIQSGQYPLAYGSDNQTLVFHFDRIDMGEGETYLVATSVEEKVEPEKKQPRQPLTRAISFKSILGSVLPSQDNKVVLPNSDLSPAMRLQESDVQVFYGQSPNLMCVLSLEGNISRFNARLPELIGYDPQALVGKNLSDIVHVEDRLSVRNILCNFSRTGIDKRQEEVTAECRLIGTDEKTHWIDWVIREDQGQLYCLGHNISNVKKNEMILESQRQKLAEAQALAHMGHWRWQVGSSEIDCSDEIYGIFGVDPLSFKTTIDELERLISRRDIGRIMQAFQRAIINQNPYDMDFRIKRYDGGFRFLRCEGRCETDEEGDVIALYGILQDITDQKQHERELQEAKESAEAAYTAKSRFLANMSHELRTPLNAIIGFSEMMQQSILGPLGSEKYYDYVTGIHESGRHLLDLISDILDMSKIEAGKYELVVEELDVCQMINLARNMVEGRALDSEIKTSVYFASEPLIINADRRALMQILLNILSNAIKFSEQGGEVSISADVQDEQVYIAISDNGIGIPAHKISVITRPFEQVSSELTRGHEGSGLGLSITKELAELHGGGLHIDSTVGEGTTVTIRMPVNPQGKAIRKDRDFL